jgi:hypothetical protein
MPFNDISITYKKKMFWWFDECVQVGSRVIGFLWV